MPITNERVDKWEFSVRKLAHYFLFASGGFVIYLILELCFKAKHKILISTFFGMLFACLDEFHQLYSQSRGPKLSDVGIDTLGVISGVIFAYLCINAVKKIFNICKRGMKVNDKFKKDNR